ncbi:MAG: hypothetical protein AB1665_03885 [Candidatus Thermoplasmatota archaeon]
MPDWNSEIETAMTDFLRVAELAGEPIEREEITVEFLHCPHQQPRDLPHGKMAVYGFGMGGKWLKIGKAGPNSNARYTSQHYTGSAKSTLAGSLRKDPDFPETDSLGKYELSDWIKLNTYRVNILISSEKPRELLSLIEDYLHLRLKPKYEG